MYPRALPVLASLIALLMALLEIALFRWLASEASSSVGCLAPLAGEAPPPAPPSAAAAWLRKRAKSSAYNTTQW